jgi:hypothetical protein
MIPVFLALPANASLAGFFDLSQTFEGPLR